MNEAFSNLDKVRRNVCNLDIQSFAHLLLQEPAIFLFRVECTICVIVMVVILPHKSNVCLDLNTAKYLFNQYCSLFLLVILLFFLLISFVGLTNLESLNLSFTVVTDGGLKKLSGLSSLKSLNLDARHVTDVGLAALTSKCV